VTFERLSKAVHAQVPGLNQHREDLDPSAEYHYTVRCLRRLGFVRSGEATFERNAAKQG
jgi:hypothetical protein